MQMPIHQGKMVPETDAERVDEQFKVFNRTFGPRVLRTLTEAVQRGESVSSAVHCDGRRSHRAATRPGAALPPRSGLRP